MLRTNSKQAKKNIANYITKDTRAYIADQYEIETTTDAETLAAIYYIFKSEKLDHDKMWSAGRVSEYEMFKDWAQGLALGGLFCYYYNRPAVDDLGDILEETEEERAKYTEEQAEEMLTRLIYREVITAKNKTSF